MNDILYPEEIENQHDDYLVERMKKLSLFEKGKLREGWWGGLINWVEDNLDYIHHCQKYSYWKFDILEGKDLAIFKNYYGIE